MLHVLLIFPPVGLRAQRVYRRALSEVQHPVLDAAAVRRLGHFAAQRVELTHQVPLSRAADGGIAGHIANRVEVDREDDGRKAHPRAGKPRFYSCVSRADDGHIVAPGRVIHMHRLRFM